jgi:RNA polymerase sigma-70 factor (ECF subfamily)
MPVVHVRASAAFRVSGSESVLVTRARNGDREAFAILYDEHQAAVHQYVYRRVRGDRYLADDLVSETFLRALCHIGSFAWRRCGVRAWLITIARNLVADHYRSWPSRCEVSMYEVPESGQTAARSPEDQVLDAFEYRRLLAAVAGLTSRKQTVVSLRYWRDLPGRQVARRMGCSVGAVKSLQHRATCDLRSAMRTREVGELA